MKLLFVQALLTGLTRFFTKGYPNQRQRDNTQKSSYLRLSNLLCQIENHISSKSSSVKTANLQNTITATILKVNTSKSFVTNMAAIQPATKLEQTAEKTRSWATVGSKTKCILPAYKLLYILSIAYFFLFHLSTPVHVLLYYKKKISINIEEL